MLSPKLGLGTVRPVRQGRSAMVNMTAFVEDDVPVAVKVPVGAVPVTAPRSATVAVMWPPDVPVAVRRRESVVGRLWLVLVSDLSAQ